MTVNPSTYSLKADSKGGSGNVAGLPRSSAGPCYPLPTPSAALIGYIYRAFRYRRASKVRGPEY